MFDSYRAVLSRPGAVWFSAAGLVGRWPLAMAGLGIVLLVQSHDGSYGVAGSVSAAYLVANAAVAVPLARRVDALGQARVLTAASVVFGAATTALIVSVDAGWPRGATYALAAAAGGFLPPVDASVRTRWAYVLDTQPQVETAYSLESVVDEVVFMTGPIVVTLLVTLVDPAAGLVAAIVTGVGGGLAFAAQRGTEPPAHPRERTDGPRPVLPWRSFVPILLVCAALGLLFGAAEVTSVAFAREHGSTSVAGALLALWALGSLVAGAVSGAVTWRRDLVQRLRLGALGMAVAMAPLALVHTVWLMGLLMLVGGVAIAPTLISVTALVEQVTPSARLNEGMGLLQTGLVIGVAPGAAVAGVVVDHVGASPAYLVPLAAGVAAAVAALALPRATRPTQSVRQPTVTAP